MDLPYKRGVAAEKRVAKAVGGKTTPGSGNKWYARGDVTTADLHIQVKTTTRKSYALSLKELVQNEEQAASADKDAAFVVEFTTPARNHRFIVKRLY